MNTIISAEAVLKSKSNSPLLQEDIITSENIKEFIPAQSTIDKATLIFQQLGFLVTSSGVTLTLIAPIEKFEEVFKTKLILNTHPKVGTTAINSSSELILPDSLKAFVEKVIFSETPELFSHI
jgi:hypothetical protein